MLYPEQDVNKACEFLIKNSVSLNSVNLLVTGATGFVGSWLLNVTNKLQLDYGQTFKVFGVSRNLNFARERLGEDIFKHVQWVNGAIQDVDLSDIDFSHVIHAATPTTLETGAGDLEGVKNSSVGGLKNILNACALKKAKTRILHTSSGTVYQGAIDEFGRSNLHFDVANNRNPNNLKHIGYLEAKLETEALLANATKRSLVSGVNVRLFAFFGPGLPIDSHYAIGNFMRDAIRGREIQISGTGQATRSYLAGYKMAANILYALTSQEEKNFHIGSTEGEKLYEWAERVGSLFGKKVLIKNEFEDKNDYYVAGFDPKLPKFGEDEINCELLKWKKYLIDN